MQRGPTIVSLVIGLLILSAVFWALERWRPSIRHQRRTPAETRTDLVYWFFTPLVTRAVTRIALGVIFALLAVSQGLTFADLRHAVTQRQTWASSLPVAIQVPLMLVLADLLAYWTHRLFHGRRLWRFHAIHHSSRTVDGLSSVRLHPVNDAVARIVQVLPLYQPTRFGLVNDNVPSGLVGQLLYPFRRPWQLHEPLRRVTRRRP